MRRPRHYGPGQYSATVSSNEWEWRCAPHRYACALLVEKVSLTAWLAAWLAAFARCAQGEGKRDTSVIMIKMHYPILGEDMKDAGRVF
eukprot:COSAG01_NODE_43099_length_433_cov_0.916168_1_plen_87_part_10